MRSEEHCGVMRLQPAKPVRECAARLLEMISESLFDEGNMAQNEKCRTLSLGNFKSRILLWNLPALHQNLVLTTTSLVAFLLRYLAFQSVI